MIPQKHLFRIGMLIAILLFVFGWESIWRSTIVVRSKQNHPILCLAGIEICNVAEMVGLADSLEYGLALT